MKKTKIKEAITNDWQSILDIAIKAHCSCEYASAEVLRLESQGFVESKKGFRDRPSSHANRVPIKLVRLKCQQ
jgi:hypothetical protein